MFSIVILLFLFCLNAIVGQIDPETQTLHPYLYQKAIGEGVSQFEIWAASQAKVQCFNRIYFTQLKWQDEEGFNYKCPVKGDDCEKEHNENHHLYKCCRDFDVYDRLRDLLDAGIRQCNADTQSLGGLAPEMAKTQVYNAFVKDIMNPCKRYIEYVQHGDECKELKEGINATDPPETVRASQTLESMISTTLMPITESFTYPVGYTHYPPLSQNLVQQELCVDHYNRFNDTFYVSAAFRVDKYIGLLGFLKAKDEEYGKSVAIRVMYYPEEDRSGYTSYPYFDAKVWNEIRSINESQRVNYVFNTNGISNKLFVSQNSEELVYFVQAINTTTAYQFDKQKVKDMSEPTYNSSKDMFVVYDPYSDMDDSEYLSIKNLLSHFWGPIRVLDILIVDIHVGNETIYYALVYTEEFHENQIVYFRHHMKSETYAYSGDTNRRYLKWDFEEKLNYCYWMKKRVTAVVHLWNEVDRTEPSDEVAYRTFFIEFYGTYHAVRKLVYIPPDRFVKRFAQRWLKIDDSMNFTNVIDNSVLLNCRPHPKFFSVKDTECKDYPMDPKDGINFVNVFESGSHSGHSVSNFYSISILVVVITILVVMAIGIYLVITPKPQKTI